MTRDELRRHWREATSWAAPMRYWSFLSLRTIFLSYAVGALVGWLIGGTVVAIIVGTVIYVVAAVHPRNVTTCPVRLVRRAEGQPLSGVQLRPLAHLGAAQLTPFASVRREW